MACFQCKRGAGSGYVDGDIIVAYNTERIERLHAQSICCPRSLAENSRGFWLDPLGLAQTYLQQTSTWQFDRTGFTTVRRTTLATGSSVDEDWGSFVRESVTVSRIEETLKLWKRTNHGLGARGKPLFGFDGTERWFGGNTRTTAAGLTAIWDEIERLTPCRRAEPKHQTVRMNRRRYLVLEVDDFDNDERRRLMEDRVRRQVTNITIDTVTPGATSNRWVVGVTGHFGNQIPIFCGDGDGIENPTRLHDTEGNVYPCLELRGPNVLVRGNPMPAMGGAEQAQAVTRTNLGKRRRKADYRNGILSPAELAVIDSGVEFDAGRELSRAALVSDKGVT